MLKFLFIFLMSFVFLGYNRSTASWLIAYPSIVISLTRFSFLLYGFQSLLTSLLSQKHTVSWLTGRPRIFAAPLGSCLPPVSSASTIFVFHSSSGGWNFHSLLGGCGFHSLWPRMTAWGTAFSLPPTVRLHRGNVWVVPVAAQKSRGCGRCEPAQHGDEISSREGIDVPSRKRVVPTSFSKSWWVEIGATPHKMAGKVNSKQHSVWNIGPCMSFSL